MQHSLNYRSQGRAIVALACLLVSWLCALRAEASPEAKILRVDPRAAQDNGNPVLTTVVEVSQSKRVSDAIANCGTLTGNSQFDCMSVALEKPFALYTPFPFPAQNVEDCSRMFSLKKHLNKKFFLKYYFRMPVVIILFLPKK